RLEMRLEIRRLHQSLGLTTLYVTHDQEEALSLADRVVLMRDGVIEQSGTPEELYAQPRSLYVANFLGYRNLVPVTVGEVRGDAGPPGRPRVDARARGTPRRRRVRARPRAPVAPRARSDAPAHRARGALRARAVRVPVRVRARALVPAVRRQRGERAARELP